jgi:hypothetical protein
LSYLFTDIGTNEKFRTDKSSVVRLQTFNNVYTLRIKWMQSKDKWRDQFDQSVTKVTPEESIQTRCVVVDSKTKDTPILSCHVSPDVR